MSYDFEIWTQKQVDLKKLNLEDGWRYQENYLEYTSKNWIITCDINKPCELEDIPKDILPLIPSIQYLIEITVQPFDAPQKAIMVAKRLAKNISNQAAGVVLDKQTDEKHLPVGYKKFITPKLSEGKRINILQFVWYMKHSKFTEEHYLEKIIELFKVYLPEGLPK